MGHVYRAEVKIELEVHTHHDARLVSLELPHGIPP